MKRLMRINLFKTAIFAAVMLAGVSPVFAGLFDSISDAIDHVTSTVSATTERTFGVGGSTAVIPSGAAIIGGSRGSSSPLNPTSLVVDAAHSLGSQADHIVRAATGTAAALAENTLCSGTGVACLYNESSAQDPARLRLTSVRYLDGANQLLREVFFDAAGRNIRETRYDAQSHLISGFSDFVYDTAGTLAWEIRRNASGIAQRADFLNGGTAVLAHVDYVYRNNGNELAQQIWYDAQNRLVSDVTYAAGSGLPVWRRVYNEARQVVETTYYVAGQAARTFHYDELNRLVRDDVFQNGTLVHSSIITYHGNTQNVEWKTEVNGAGIRTSAFYFEAGKNYFSWRFSYDATGMKLTKQDYFVGGNAQANLQVSIHLDSQGRKIAEDLFTAGVRTTRINYDAATGRKKTVQIYQNGVLQWIQTFRNCSNGVDQLIRSDYITVSNNGSTAQRTWSFLYTYDASGRLIMEQRYHITAGLVGTVRY